MLLLRLLCAACFLGAVAMMAAGGYMNYRFLTTQAHFGVDRYVLGIASVAIDVVKAALVALIAHGWRRGRYVYVLIGFVVLAPLGLLSLASAIGFAAETRGSVTGERDALHDRYAYKRQELEALEAQLRTIGVVRPAALVEAEMKAAGAQGAALGRRACQAKVGPKLRAACDSYIALSSEAVAAREAEKLAKATAALRHEVQSLVDSGAKRPADRQARLVAQLLGVDELRISEAIGGLLALVVELGGALGVYLALGLLLEDAKPSEKRSGRPHLHYRGGTDGESVVVGAAEDAGKVASPALDEPVNGAGAEGRVPEHGGASGVGRSGTSRRGGGTARRRSVRAQGAEAPNE